MAARMEALEARIAELEAKLVEPKPITPPKPKATIEAAARVFHVPTRNPGFVTPNAGELDQLWSIVVRAVPALAPSRTIYGNAPDDVVVRRDFAAAVRAVGTILAQRDAVDHSRGPEFWCEHINGQLRLTGRPSISSQDFTAAALALNVRHCIPLASASFGFMWGGSGRPFIAEWRAVLANGRIRGPDPLPGEYGQWSMGVSSWVRPG